MVSNLIYLVFKLEIFNDIGTCSAQACFSKLDPLTKYCNLCCYM